MKLRNIIIAGLLVVLVLVLAVGSNGIAVSAKKVSPAKIVIVDMEKVILKSKSNAVFEKAFKAKADEAKKEMADIEDEIELLRDSFGPLKRTSQAYADRANRLMRKEMELEVKRKFYNQSLPMERQRWIEGAFIEVGAVVEKIAQAEGYDIVISNEGRRVLYSSDALDITETVLAAWDSTVK